MMESPLLLWPFMLQLWTGPYAQVNANMEREQALAMDI